MGLGGPVWHVSSSAISEPLSEQFLRVAAYNALQGVGRATLGQWEEWTGVAYHIRRRLTYDEQKSVGDARDIRGTQEATKRRLIMQPYLPASMKDYEG